MIDLPTVLPAKKDKHRKKSVESTPVARPLVHEIMNQLTVINLCCFKFRAAAKAAPEPSLLADLEKMEKAVVDLASLLEDLSQAKEAQPVQSHRADALRAKPRLERSMPDNVYSFAKPTRRRR